MLGGFIISKLHLEKYVEDFVWKVKSQKHEIESKKEPFVKIFKTISREAFDITKKIILYVLAGVGL